MRRDILPTLSLTQIKKKFFRFFFCQFTSVNTGINQSHTMYLFPQIKKSMDCNYVKENKGIESILLFIKSHKQPHLLYLSVSVLVSIHVTFTGFLIHLQKTHSKSQKHSRSTRKYRSKDKQEQATRRERHQTEQFEAEFLMFLVQCLLKNKVCFNI